MLNIENEELSSSVELSSDTELSTLTDDVCNGNTNMHKVCSNRKGNFIGSTEIPHIVNILPSMYYMHVCFIRFYVSHLKHVGDNHTSR